MTGHSKEPWRVQHPHAGMRGWEIADSSGLNQVSQDVTDANARRIVACVNACRGLSTDVLERMPTGGLLNATAELLTRRAQLLEALEAVVEWYDMEADHSIEPDFYKRMAACQVSEEMARSAIAAARGEQ